MNERKQWSAFVAGFCVAMVAAVLLLKTQKRTFKKVVLDEASGEDDSVSPFLRIGKHFDYLTTGACVVGCDWTLQIKMQML